MNVKRLTDFLRSMSYSKIGISVGLVLASVSLITIVGGYYFIQKIMEGENRAYVQQAIGDTALILSTHFRTEFEHLQENLNEIADKFPTTFSITSPVTSLVTSLVTSQTSSQLKATPQVASAAPSPVVVSTVPPVVDQTMEIDPEIIDISVWKRGQKVSAFEIYPDPEQIYYVKNSRLPDLSDKLTQYNKLPENSGKDFIQNAFEGHTVIALDPKWAGPPQVALIAIPFKHEGRDEVIKAHLKIDQLQKAFGKNRMVYAILVDDFGNVLAYPDSTSSNRQQNGMSGNPLFVAMHSSSLSSGQLTFTDEKGSLYFGGYSRIGIGHLAVLASLPVAEVMADQVMLRRQAALFATACFLFFLDVGYLVSIQIFLRGKTITPDSLNRISPISPEKSEVTSPSGIMTAPTVHTVRKEFLWLVNNGSQIIGPLTPHEIASRLFAQELDFDCECWEEGTGHSAQIKTAGIFTGSQDKQANKWIYDGETIHGPVTSGFLKTAQAHGAISPSAYICEESTVNGWKLLPQAELKSEVEPKTPVESEVGPKTPVESEVEPKTPVESEVTAEPKSKESSTQEPPQKKAA